MFDRDEQEISQMIEGEIDAILSGAKSLEEVLAAYPEQAEVIRSELEAASWLISHQAEVSPRPGFVLRSRKRVIERIQQEASNQNIKHSFFGLVWPQRLVIRWVAVILIVAVLLSSTGGLVSDSQSAMPGDNLYLIKRASEEVTYTVTLNTNRRIQLNTRYAKRRLQEAAALIAKKNFKAALPILQDFQKQVNQAVALLQEAAGNKARTPDELQEQKSIAITLQQELAQSVNTLEVMEAETLPVEVLDSIRAAQQFTQSSLKTTEVMISEINASLDLQNATPTPSLQPVNTVTQAPAGEVVEPGTTPAVGATPGEMSATVIGEPGDVFDPLILITPTPTGMPSQLEPGNPVHQTPTPEKAGNNPPKDGAIQPTKAGKIPPGQAKKTAQPTNVDKIPPGQAKKTTQP